MSIESRGDAEADASASVVYGYACFLPAATGCGSLSLANVRERRLGAIAMLFWTSLTLGIAQAISPMSRFSRF
jgi:hypothetical protein